ncbi:hypothetical protein JIG36_35720 [Actinoplanes sp. LDG1-06]|uniref:Peptidase inhibitor family I36 n=1 Tax=Paractinoplanes ovalisporus TaxID=2810368 RepID=A0ABS2ALX9_9ACTN|nr:hypothetical protein [Actinoplanes ovalisporus]MBM2620863.1 hypothetical protein [Actinoplanes ovalisporus]
MRRIVMVFIACLSVLGVALSAAPAGAAGKNELEISRLAVADWDCTAGYSCYYDSVGGRDKLFRAERCGQHDLRGGPYQNRINSIANYGAKIVYVYAYDVEARTWHRKGWVQPGQRGNLPDMPGDPISIDMINIIC